MSELASAADTSLATVVRFCQDLGYAGYQDLKLRLARETAVDDALWSSDWSSEDASGVARMVLSESAEAFRNAITNIDPWPLEIVADRLLTARRVLFLAVGTSAPLASDAAYRLATLGLVVSAPPDVHVQHVTARLLQPGDLCVAISHTGSTTETVAAARSARDAGADTAAITSFARSPLVDIVDHVIVAGSPETAYRVEAMTSRLVHIAVLDALFVLVARRGGDESQTALATSADVLTQHRF